MRRPEAAVSALTEPAERGMRIAALWALLLLLCAAGFARAQPAAPPQLPAPRIGVVTMGPGDIFWERFGHDAIVVDDPAGPGPVSYNFGFFDLEEAGFAIRQPGCSACLAMNDDKIPAGKYSVSTSNRNFEGRQGPGSRTILASPLVAAAAAVTGVITDPRELM